MLARPLTRYRTVLLLAMIGLFIGALAIPAVRDFYALSLPSQETVAIGLAIAAGGCVALELGIRAVRRWAPTQGEQGEAATTSPAS
jgi:hypothetical protein